MKRWFTLFLISIAGLVIFDKFQTRIIQAHPLEEVVVKQEKQPEWPSHDFICKRLYQDITQHGQFMRCIRADI